MIMKKKLCQNGEKKVRRKKTQYCLSQERDFDAKKKFSLFIFILFLKIILGNNKFQDNHKFFVSKTRFLNKTKKNFIFF